MHKTQQSFIYLHNQSMLKSSGADIKSFSAQTARAAPSPLIKQTGLYDHIASTMLTLNEYNKTFYKKPFVKRKGRHKF
jgi:hypothetical protein